MGVKFPFNQPMKLYSSLWNADDWATRGGLEKTDWSKAPFVTSYKGFHIDGCKASVESKFCNTQGKRWWDQKDSHEFGQIPPSATTTSAAVTTTQPQPLNKHLLKNYNPVAYVTVAEDTNDNSEFTEEKSFTTKHVPTIVFFNGVQVVDKDGFLVGEFSKLDDLSICASEHGLLI